MAEYRWGDLVVTAVMTFAAISTLGAGAFLATAVATIFAAASATFFLSDAAHEWREDNPRQFIGGGLVLLLIALVDIAI